MKKNLIVSMFLIVFLSTIGICFNAVADPILSIDNYTLESSKYNRRTRTWFLEYAASVTNVGTDAINVVATLSNDSPAVIINDGELSFGDVASGSTVASQDTFIIELDRTLPDSVGEIIWNFSFSPPDLRPQITLTASPAIINQGESATLTWSSTNGNTAFIEPGIGSVAVNDSVVVTPNHTTTYTITVTGPEGSASANTVISITGETESQPEGSFGEQYNDQIPPDSTVGNYDPKRFSLITGQVRDILNNPLMDVNITIFNHPEYGTAKTNEQGQFTIPVDGGGLVKVIYQKQGYITSHRQVNVPWNDFAITETIQMITEDPVSTTLTFDGNPDTIVTHKSTPVTDESGTRSCTMVFQGDNQAFLVDKNGNDIQELTTITTRASEYTTPESMPAVLPPTSAYTYCAELSVDGAARVRFAKPVITWVDNFLGFDVGEIVPVGYYDRDRGVWKPSDNGVVVRLLDTDSDGTVDALDATGDGNPDDLNNDGSFSDEVIGLDDDSLYVAGATFWRVSLTHFTPWDYNWPWGLPDGAIDPNPKGSPTADSKKDPNEDCENHNSSFVEERSRIFHEDISIPGTNMTLHYSSNRAKGYKTSVIDIPVSGDTVPDTLKAIIVKVSIAGRTFTQTFDPLPNIETQFAWDGLDSLGSPVSYPTVAHIEIGFQYDLVYFSASSSGFAQSFGQVGKRGAIVIYGLGRQDMVSWIRTEINIHPTGDILAKSGGFLAEGWTLSNHHFGSNIVPTLFKGDGSTITNYSGGIVTTVAGMNYGYGRPVVDVSIATETPLGRPAHIFVDSEGNFYFSDISAGCIQKVDTNGNMSTVAGNGFVGYSGDGGPAKEAQFYYPKGITIDLAGNLYIADSMNYCIRKVDTNGIITTVAGIGGYHIFSGDGGPATQAGLGIGVNDVCVDSMGNLYIAAGYRIRKVDTNGIISTIVGDGTFAYSGDGGPAIEAQIEQPLGLFMDTKGNLYISTWSRIRKMDVNGIITTVAGNGTAAYGGGDGGPAIQAQLYAPGDCFVDEIGNIYIADTLNSCVRKVDVNGVISTVAGDGTYNYSGDGGPAKQAQFYYPNGIYGDAIGNLYIAGNGSARIRKISINNIQGTTFGEMSFPEDNGLGHIMFGSGHHQKTVDLNTGVVLREFGYNEDMALISITDRFGGQITIARDGNGVPTSITSPDGITTTLSIDTNNHLNKVTYPNGSYFEFEYTSDGLMTTKIEPEGNRFEHVFDSNGRLTDSLDQEGGHWNYTRTLEDNGDIITEVLTAEGNFTTYQDHTYSTGLYESTIVSSAGGVTEYSRSADGLIKHKSLACGMDQTFMYDLDPKYQYKYLREIRESTPSLLEKITTNNTSRYFNNDGVLYWTTKTITVNGKPTTLVQDTRYSSKKLTSPMGRVATTYYDPLTLLTTSIEVPGLETTVLEHNDQGRLTETTTGTRQTTFTYNNQGLLESNTDAGNSTTYYSYDEVGRLNRISRPDTTSLWFDYDANGNMTILTNPTTIDHSFGFNNINKKSSYSTPLSGNYSYQYDKDRRLISTTLPSGKQINNIYDTAQLAQTQTPDGNIDYTYSCSSKIDSISKNGESIAYTYDGKLLTSESLTGSINQTIGYGYNNDFNAISITYSGGTENIAYDNDGLLTEIGNYTITRNVQNGLPESVSGGALSMLRGFNGYGELETQNVTINSQAASIWNLTRDDNGRITSKTETIDGAIVNFSYEYDSMGRLLTVTKDGVLVEEYSYSLNGSREYEMNTLKGITGRALSYSAEDHLLSAGTTTYQYDLDGFLTQKNEGTNISLYNYSSRGELLSVTQPDSTLIEYDHDPMGRRITKKINGQIVEKYLWQGLTRLLATYDGADNILQRFEYADGRMPVSMTQGVNRYYLTYDQIGSLRLVADASGNVVKRIDYDTFGSIISDSNPGFKMPFGFAGGLHDTDTGLVRFGYRDYDPQTGRWTAKDPIGFAGGDTDLYGYVLNDPVNLVDPTGEFASIIGGAIGGGIIGGLAGGIVGGVSSYLSGDSMRGVINSAIVGAGIGAIAGGVAGGLAGAGIIGPLGLAAGDFWGGFNVAVGVGKSAALSSKLGALAGGVASIFTDPGEAHGSEDKPCK